MSMESAIGTVNTDWLNLRTSPGGRVLTILKGGSEVNVVGQNGGWLDIWYGSLRGSVASRYITIPPRLIAEPPPEAETPHSPVPVAERKGEVTASALNLRSAPNGHILGKLHRGDIVTIASEANGWMEVNTNTRQGYVSSQYIRPRLVHRQPTPARPASPPNESLHFDGDWAIGPDNKRFAKKFRKGIYSSGNTKIAEFIDSNRSEIDSISHSQLRLLEAVSENEGKLEAINTWDNAYLSFGIFQWTAGVGSEAGELPALFDRLQKRFPEVYAEFFGRFGLELSGVTERQGTPARGYFKVNGQVLTSSSQKEALRALPWPYRCKTAGMNDKVRLVQLEHAIARIDCFLKVDNRVIRNNYIGDYVTSEYGIAQLLDQHVNRPAHVLPTLRKAVEALEEELPIDTPETWGDAEERKLMQTYLSFREQTSMTDGVHRARRIKRQLDTGIISDTRNSYQTTG